MTIVYFDTMELLTSDISTIAPFIKKLRVPEKNSHKGQNGRTLVIGGSSLFHASSIWAAEVASHFVDIVHFASTEENNKILFETKKKFHNGIIIARANVLDYAKEDDSILIGPGMVRNEKVMSDELRITNFSEVLAISDEAVFTQQITKYLLEYYPDKRFVLDAGALQMMKPEWLKHLKVPALITPHQLEFERLFSIAMKDHSLKDKAEIVKKTAREFRCVILLKAVDDIISDGNAIYIVRGGNQGLTKGGTGDILAGLSVGLYSKNDAIDSAVLASYLLKKTADNLLSESGYWYNNDNLIDAIAKTLASLYKIISPHSFSS